MSWKSALLLLLFALVLRLAAGLWWQSQLPPGERFRFGDSESYWMLGQKLAAGEPYALNPDRRVFRTPGYPLLLAPLFAIARDEPPILWARWQNAVFGTVAVLLVMLTTRRLFDPPAAWIAGVAATFYPGAIATSVFVLSEGPYCPLMVAQILLWIVAFQTADARRQVLFAGLAGVAAGAATLVRPSWLLFTPFAIGWGCLLSACCSGPSRAMQLRIGLTSLATLILVMCPWWIRNARVVGGFVPTTLQVGESLYDGLSPSATGASDMRFVDRFREAMKAEDLAAGAVSEHERPFEWRLDRRMRDEALSWSLRNPQRVLQLAGIKFLRIWNVWPNEPSLRSGAFRMVVAAGYLPLLLCSLAGAVRFARRGWPYLLCLLPAVYVTCLHVVFVGSLRYRQPAMLLMIVLAAGWLAEIGKRLVQRDSDGEERAGHA